MLDKKHIFRRINFIVFISYSLLSILNDLNITTIPLPIDLSVCIVLFLCFNSIFEQNNDSIKIISPENSIVMSFLKNAKTTSSW